MERENPVFKEFVKIAISPMLLSLSIMTFAESEHEILGLGIGVILLNIGMYFVLPFVICHYVKRIVRTCRLRKANWSVISSNTVINAVKKSLFGIIVLMVLTVSVSSAFETAYAEGEDPIQIVLDITYENIQGSLDGVDDHEANALFLAGEEKYFEAIAALEAGDIATAKDSALIAMALFEDSAEEIGSLEDPTTTRLPPGLGTAVSNLFEVQEQITGIDKEVAELFQLAESNGIDVNFEEYNESINLAKQVLANGDIPNAQAKLALANEIKSDIIDQMNTAVEESQDERIQEFVDNSIASIEEMLEKGENLGLTKKAIRELEETLEVLKSGDIDDILEKTDENSDLAKELDGDETPEDSPGKSGDAPGQSRGNDEAELPPGFDSASDTGKANGNGQGLGLGKIPPGLAKLFGYDDGTGENKDYEAPEGLPAGFGLGNIPPGQLKKFDVSFAFNDNPDDYFENHYEAEIDDVWKANFDGTNRGNSEGKGMFGAWAGKSGDDPSFKFNQGKHGNPPGKAVGKPFCSGKAIGGDPAIILLGSTPIFHILSVIYTDAGARACEPGITEITNLIIVSGLPDVNVEDVYTISYDVTSLKFGPAATVTRTVLVGDIVYFEISKTQSQPPVNSIESTIANFTTTIDIGQAPDTDVYHEGIIQNILANDATDVGVIGYLDSSFNPIASFDNYQFIAANATNTYYVDYIVTETTGTFQSGIIRETVNVIP